MKARWCFMVLLLACGDDASADSTIDEQDAEFMGCPADVPMLSLGAQARGNAIAVSVVDADHVPAQRYLNAWTFRFTDLAGAPLNDVSVVSARTWMPVHGHDGLVTPQVLSTSDLAELEVRNLNFNMRGPWEVQLSLRSASAGTDDIVFHVCIAE